MVKCVRNRFSKRLGTAKMNPKVVLRRIDLSSEVRCIKTNPVVLLRRVDFYQQAKTNFMILVPRLRFANCKSNNQDNIVFTSRELDITEDDSPQYNKQNIVARLPENNSSLNRLENDSVDETPSHRNSYESDWFNKKYKPYMEKIRNLTHDDISTFVKKNNKEYYEKIIDAQKPAKRNVNPDTKDLFKCNPFNSEQQLAMYLTLRQLFNVPETHFKQYKTFFTIIMPEISCQLFAQVFNVKVKSAPKLIKKLYPDPISPF